MSANKWKVEIRPKAVKQITKLSPKDRAGVLLSIEQLAQADNPPLAQGVKYKKGVEQSKGMAATLGTLAHFLRDQTGENHRGQHRV